MRLSTSDPSGGNRVAPSRASRLKRTVGTIPLVVALTQACGGSEEALDSPRGRAEVLPDGTIVLTGCPPDLIDTRETYELSTPTGACQTSASCEVRTQQWCLGGIQGPILDWGCTCVDGAWSCQVTSKRMQYCPTVPSNPPVGDSLQCAYDPQRRQGIECQGDVSPCELTTIQQCPGGAQGRTNRWSCACAGFPLLAPGTRVWSCERLPGESQTCSANNCPIISSYSVNQASAAVGERVELRASVRDDDGDDVTVRWSATLGRFINPYNGNTGYTCSESGTAKLTFVVADNACETSISVDLECTP